LEVLIERGKGSLLLECIALKIDESGRGLLVGSILRFRANCSTHRPWFIKEIPDVRSRFQELVALMRSCAILWQKAVEILGLVLEFCGASRDKRVFVSRLNIRVDLIESFIAPIHVAEANKACSFVIALLLKR
jgi:hypothetical protein